MEVVGDLHKSAMVKNSRAKTEREKKNEDSECKQLFQIFPRNTRPLHVMFPLPRRLYLHSFILVTVFVFLKDPD